MYDLIGANEVNRLLRRANGTQVDTAAFLENYGLLPIGRDSRGAKWALKDVEALAAKLNGAGSDHGDTKYTEALGEVGETLQQFYDYYIAESEHVRQAIVALRADVSHINNQRAGSVSALQVIHEQVETLILGNREIFKRVEAVEKMVADRVDRLGRATDTLIDRMERLVERIDKAPPLVMVPATEIPETETHAPTTAKPKAKAATEPRPYRPAIGIVGVAPAWRSVLEREFGECFTLKILGPNDTKQLAGLAACKKVFVMESGTQSKHITLLREAGQEPMKLRGGLTTLRGALTDYFANHC